MTSEEEEAYKQAFVDGAKWWEWALIGATMWPSDMQEAYKAAEEHLRVRAVREAALRERETA